MSDTKDKWLSFKERKAKQEAERKRQNNNTFHQYKIPVKINSVRPKEPTPWADTNGKEGKVLSLQAYRQQLIDSGELKYAKTIVTDSNSANGSPSECTGQEATDEPTECDPKP